MTREQINKTKTEDSSILMESEQFVILNHKNLKSAIRITWTHGTHILKLTKTDNKDYISESGPVDLSKKNVLVLNPSHERHERLYKIEIDELNQRIDLIELHDMSAYKTTLKIVDSQ